MARLGVLKTYKLFIDGKFPRTESGRYYELKSSNGKVIANVCLGSRKDFRNAVVAARASSESWSARSAFNRSQILYRIAEMLEARASQFVDELIVQGAAPKKSKAEVETCIDRMVYYAGWCDKYQAVYSSVNPVASSHFNFSVPEPAGVVSMICGPSSGLAGVVSMVAPALAGGNTCVLLAPEKFPLSAVTFGEVLATSDLPPGVVNIITGNHAELADHFSSHFDVNALVYCGSDKKLQKLLMENCALNVKRFFNWEANCSDEEAQHPSYIMDLQEIKTTWHPVDHAISGSVAY